MILPSLVEAMNKLGGQNHVLMSCYKRRHHRYEQKKFNSLGLARSTHTTPVAERRSNSFVMDKNVRNSGEGTANEVNKHKNLNTS